MSLSPSDAQSTTRHALITGISGFTGDYLAQALSASGYRVSGTRVPERAAAEQADGADAPILPLDITDEAACIALIDRVRPSHIVHLAARTFVADDDALGFYGSNVLGTLNLLQACAKVGHVPERIVIASSANIYGNAAGTIDEGCVAAPVNHYGASKLAMECLVRTWEDRLPIVITRPFNYTGQHQSVRLLIPKIVSHFIQKKDRIELGNLDVVRDFSDVRYVADVYKGLLENQAAIGQTVNICSESEHALGDVIDLCRELSGQSIDVHVNPAFVRANEIKFLIGSAEKLRRLVPDAHPIGLRETIAWMLAQAPDHRDGRN